MSEYGSDAILKTKGEKGEKDGRNLVSRSISNKLGTYQSRNLLFSSSSCDSRFSLWKRNSTLIVKSRGPSPNLRTARKNIEKSLICPVINCLCDIELILFGHLRSNLSLSDTNLVEPTH